MTNRSTGDGSQGSSDLWIIGVLWLLNYVGLLVFFGRADFPSWEYFVLVVLMGTVSAAFFTVIELSLLILAVETYVRPLVGALSKLVRWIRQKRRDRKAHAAIGDIFCRGDGYLRMCHFRKAIEVYEAGLKLCESMLKCDSPYTASACNRLGTAQMGVGYVGPARDCFYRALLILSEWPDHYDELHLSVAENLIWLRDETGF
jgi:hypothetical protein